MAALGVEVIKSFVDSTTADTTTTNGTTTAYGTIKSYNSTMFVQIDGSTMYTPIASTTTKYSDGDRVLVTIKDHKIGVSGNFTEPSETASAVEATVDLSVNNLKANEINALFVKTDQLNADLVSTKKIIADDATIEKLVADGATIYNLVSTKASIDDLTAAKADITTLKAESITAKTLNSEIIKTESFQATDASIKQLKSDLITTNGLVAEKANITDLTVAAGRIGTLETNYVTVNEKLTAAEARIIKLDSDLINTNELVAQKADLTYVKANYADINLANVDTAIIKAGTIVDGAIVDAMIGDVSANKLTAGVIDASDITVTNINASNINVGTITVGGIKMDFSKGVSEVGNNAIATGAITADKLSQEVQDQIDGAIETWTVTATPTLHNEPASNWEDDAARAKHVGDVAYVVNQSGQGSSTDGFCYRFCYDSTTSTYSWALIQDTDVTKALGQIETMGGTISEFKSEYTTFTKNTDSKFETVQKAQTTLEAKVGDGITGDDGSIISLTTKVTNNADRIETAEGSITNLTKTVDTNTASIDNIKETTVTKAAYEVNATSWTNSIKELQTTTYGNEDDPDSVAKSLVNRTTKVEGTLDGITTDIYKTTVDETTGETVKTLDVYHKEESAALVKTKFDSLIIGSTNLMIGTETSLKITGTGAETEQFDTYTLVKTPVMLAGKQITLSGHIVATGSVDDIGTFNFMTHSLPEVEVDMWGVETPTSFPTDQILNESPYSVMSFMTSGGADFEIHAIIAEDTNDDEINVQLMNSTSSLTFSNVQLEIGNKKTDWHPAANDRVSSATYMQDSTAWNANFKMVSNNIGLDATAESTSIRIDADGVSIGKENSNLESHFRNDTLDFDNNITGETVLQLNANDSSVKAERWKMGDYIWYWDPESKSYILTYNQDVS